MWQDWYKILSFLDATPIRVSVSRTLRKSSFSARVTSTKSVIKIMICSLRLLLYLLLFQRFVHHLESAKPLWPFDLNNQNIP